MPKRGGGGRGREGDGDVKRRRTTKPTEQQSSQRASGRTREEGVGDSFARGKFCRGPAVSYHGPRPHPYIRRSPRKCLFRKPLGCTLVADKTGVPSALLKRRIRLGLKPVPRTPARRGVKEGGNDDEITCSELHSTRGKGKQAAQKPEKTRRAEQNREIK